MNEDYEVFNPLNKDPESLPVIYGFNNGGRPEFWNGEIISQDGDFLGGHLCSNEGYMIRDLGVVKGSRPDRHKTFKEYYPGGYRMDFVSFEDAREHEGLQKAFDIYREKNPK